MVRSGAKIHNTHGAHAGKESKQETVRSEVRVVKVKAQVVAGGDAIVRGERAHGSRVGTRRTTVGGEMRDRK